MPAAAQRELVPGEEVQRLVSDVVAALPELVKSYSESSGPDLERIRDLTAQCFDLAGSNQGGRGGASGPAVKASAGRSGGLGSEPVSH